MARREYSDETKAQVMAALLAGQSVNAVAKAYQIPTGTVKSWRNAETSSVQRTSYDSERMLESLICVRIEAAITTTKAMVSVFSDSEWLERQDAYGLAVAYSTIVDGASSLLQLLDEAGAIDGD